MSQVLIVDDVVGLMRQDNKGALTIRFISNGEDHAICFPRPVIHHLIAGLVGMQSPKSGRPIDIPAIRADRFQPFQEGEATGIAAFLPGAWVIPFQIPESAIPSLKQTIADLELLAATPKGHS